MKSRRAKARLSIAGVDVSNEIAPGLLSFSFTDQASDKADDLSVTLHDRDRLWQGTWMPSKGDPLHAAIEVTDWFGEGQSMTLPCGAFEVDEVECSGPPDVIRIKGASTAVTSQLRREKTTHSWENTTLQTVGNDVAGKNGLTPLYEAPAISMQRVDQKEESDLQFLQRLARKYGLNLKVSDGQLILYAGANYDAKGVVATLTRGDSWIGRFSFRTQAHEQFKGCQVDYWDAEKKENRRQTFGAPGTPPSGQTLKINERVESEAEAKVVAQNRLRQKNKQEVEGSMDLTGDPRLLAGSTVQVAGYGLYSGKYFIEQATHTVSRGSGYTTKITIRKTLDY